MLKRGLPQRFVTEWKRINARERLMFSLLYYEGLTPTETARTLGCSVREVLRTVETRFARLSLALGRRPAARAPRPRATSTRRMAA